MSGHNFKLVYDADVIKSGYELSGHRSGLFFVALNVLKELAKRKDVDLVLTCKGKDYYCVKHVLKKEIPSTDFQFARVNKFLSLYSKLRFLKKSASLNKKCFEKFLWQLLRVVYSPVAKLAAFFRKIDLFEDYDAYFSPVYVISKTVCTKKFTLLYDLIPLKFPACRSDDWEKGFWLYDLCQTLNSDDNYFTISENTRKDFLKYYPQIEPSKIKTTLLACDEHFTPSDLQRIEIVKKKKYGIPLDKKYIFSLCTLEPRKNLERAVRTFVQFLKKNNINDMVFVLGGGHWKSFIERLDSEIKNLGEFKEKILKIGYVTDEDLPTLYSGAEWFTYTSQYEGFGLPPLEAMSCGCPVITSNNSSLPEVVGDAGVLIDWDSDQQHVKAYEKYYFDPQLRKVNREKGLARANEFSWKKCVDEMVKQMQKRS